VSTAKPIPQPERPRLWRLSQAGGPRHTHRDEEGPADGIRCMPKELPRLISIGRLDLNSEGLLLLT